MNQGSHMKKILIADDEKPVRELVKRLFGHVYKVIEADDGDIAIDIARNSKPDLILMDIMMPVMDGVEATQEIRKCKAFKDLPMIALTAHALKGNRKRFLEEGLPDYIRKPIKYKLVHSTIEKYKKKK